MLHLRTFQVMNKPAEGIRFVGWGSLVKYMLWFVHNLYVFLFLFIYIFL